MAATSEENKETLKNSVFSRKIVIIGAGIAGISTAHHLAKDGELDFIVLEASDRIGGRIHSIPLGDDCIDLGAIWIHGVLGNPVYELAIHNGLVNVTDEPKPHMAVATTEDGKRVPIHVIEEVYNAYFWFSKRCEEYFSLHLDTPPEVDSVGKHLELDISAYLQQYSEDDARMRRMVFDHLINRETCITGCHSMDETCLSDFGSYSELPGGNIAIPGGFGLVIDVLASSFPIENVCLKSEAKQIRWKMKRDSSLPNSDETNSSEKNGAHHLIAVDCVDGSTWFASHVVITVPLGVLKNKVDTLFVPHLPEYKMQCIENLSFGVVNKIFLEYDRPFLNADISDVITLWRRTDDTDMNNVWFRKIYSFRRYTDNVLLAWLSGLEAEHLETLSNEQIGNTCTDILRRFLNDPYIPKPCRVISTSWKSQPFTRGSYTFIGVKASQRDIELLAKPIYVDPYHSKPALLFAGEATHPTFYSTTHGAFLSGQKCAEILLEPESGPSLKNEQKRQMDDKDLSSWIRGIDLS